MPVAPTDLAALLAAVLLAALGGEIFLKGVLGLAAAWRLPKLLVATTLAAFATSSPELTVSTVAAISGKPEIGLGDALGSNVVNIALVFGLALLFGPLRIERQALGRDFALALATPLLTLALVADGVVSRIEGAILLAIFSLWLFSMLRRGRLARARATSGETAHPWRALLLGLCGLAAMIAAGRLFVSSASGIAAAFGVDAYVVGALVVAIGTSLPELVTVLLSRLRGHDDIGVGTLLGSNLFNGLAIVGVAATIHPIRAQPAEISVALALGVLSLLLLVPGRSGAAGRGLFLLSIYALFIVATAAVGRSQ